MCVPLFSNSSLSVYFPFISPKISPLFALPKLPLARPYTSPVSLILQLALIFSLLPSSVIIHLFIPCFSSFTSTLSVSSPSSPQKSHPPLFLPPSPDFPLGPSPSCVTAPHPSHTSPSSSTSASVTARNFSRVPMSAALRIGWRSCCVATPLGSSCLPWPPSANCAIRKRINKSTEFRRQEGSSLLPWAPGKRKGEMTQASSGVWRGHSRLIVENEDQKKKN